MTSTTLRVVTPARWLAEDFAAAAPPDVAVVHDLGLDIDSEPALAGQYEPALARIRADREDR